MNLDHFLDFWSRYNQTIIQALIVITLIFIVALVFITLFGSKNEEASVGGAHVGLSPELEKSLQKMLENQTKAAVFDFTKGGGDNAAPSTLAAIQPGTAGSTEALVQLEKMKSEMAQREKKIQELNVQLSQALSQTTKEVKGDTSALESRIKELEARLAEYDIISEDIADLSRYKEENERLKADLAGKGGAPAAVATPAAAPAAPPAAPVAPVQSQPIAAAPPTASSPAPETASEMPAAATAPTAVADAAAAATSTAIDDDLMKEFAAAVEGQKAATAPAPHATPATAESEDLMGQFENFVQKKEGS